MKAFKMSTHKIKCMGECEIVSFVLDVAIKCWARKWEMQHSRVHKVPMWWETDTCGASSAPTLRPPAPSFFFFFFCGTGAWTQSLHLEPLHQPSFFCKRFFEIGSRRTICVGWLRTVILLISASWITRITGWASWPQSSCPFWALLGLHLALLPKAPLTPVGDTSCCLHWREKAGEYRWWSGR
jgi:hypothetical protein